MESTHIDHASHVVAVRRLTPPTPRPCSLAPSVTTPLYSTTVSQTLRSRWENELLRTPYSGSSRRRESPRRAGPIEPERPQSGAGIEEYYAVDKRARRRHRRAFGPELRRSYENNPM